MARAYVIVSFGTSHSKARQASIDRLTADAAARWPDATVVQAYSGPTGEGACTLTQALDKLCKLKPDDVRICATHLTHGRDYGSVCREVERFAGRFTNISINRPLLDAPEKLAPVLARRFALREGNTYLLAAHGIRQRSGEAYAALEQAFRDLGRVDIRVAAVHGEPGLSVQGLQPEVTLVPLLLTAGHHVAHDLFGIGPDSWKSRLEQAGFAVTCVCHGLGEWPEVRQLYLEQFE